MLFTVVLLVIRANKTLCTRRFGTDGKINSIGKPAGRAGEGEFVIVVEPAGHKIADAPVVNMVNYMNIDVLPDLSLFPPVQNYINQHVPQFPRPVIYIMIFIPMLQSVPAIDHVSNARVLLVIIKVIIGQLEYFLASVVTEEKLLFCTFHYLLSYSIKQCREQLIFVLKVFVDIGRYDLGFLGYGPHGGLVKIFLGKQLKRCLHNGRPRVVALYFNIHVLYTGLANVDYSENTVPSGTFR